MTDSLSTKEKKILLAIARDALGKAVRGEHLSKIDLSALPEKLREDGASFVTLTIDGSLRGCIGALEAYQPLAQDVQEHAVAAGMQDHRFPVVKPVELPQIRIEVSYLTPPSPLVYQTPEALPEKLRPGVDGVILQDGYRRATFLPQVWEQLPDPAQFLSQLCRKMGASADLWRQKMLDVQTYQVQEFHEQETRA
jgi:hypothetical protein